MSHEWVKVGQTENEKQRYSGVGCNHEVQLQTMTCPVYSYIVKFIFLHIKTENSFILCHKIRCKFQKQIIAMTKMMKEWLYSLIIEAKRVTSGSDFLKGINILYILIPTAAELRVP